MKGDSYVRNVWRPIHRIEVKLENNARKSKKFSPNKAEKQDPTKSSPDMILTSKPAGMSSAFWKKYQDQSYINGRQSPRATERNFNGPYGHTNREYASPLGDRDPVNNAITDKAKKGFFSRLMQKRNASEHPATSNERISDAQMEEIRTRLLMKSRGSGNNSNRASDELGNNFFVDPTKYYRSPEGENQGDRDVPPYQSVLANSKVFRGNSDRNSDGVSFMTDSEQENDRRSVVSDLSDQGFHNTEEANPTRHDGSAL